jgi:cell division protein FtsQ
MNDERKISTKKVMRFAIGGVLVIIFMIALVVASYQQNTNPIKGLEVQLNEDSHFSFLQKKDVEQLLLNSRNIDLKNTAIGKLDLNMMEKIAMTNPWVADAEVFVDNRNVLQVIIKQREPAARIFDVNGYYIDSNLSVLPLAPDYSYPAPVFTSVPVIKDHDKEKKILSKMVYLSRTIARDTFWSAQITQIEVQPDESFVLIPLFGNQRLLIGDTTQLKTKLNHLLAFYKNVSGKIGWDTYQTLDVRYKNQVIAFPSIGWVQPKIIDTLGYIPEGPAPEKPVLNAVKTTISLPTDTKFNLDKAKPSELKPNQQNQQVVEQSHAVAKPKEKVITATAAKTVAKTKPVVPKSSVKSAVKPVDNKNKNAVKKDNKQEKKSPKYIYPGK